LVQPLNWLNQLPPNTTSRLAESIFQDLRRHIIHGNLLAGERLPAERQLAGAYGATRNTVREAIRKLEQGRLVTVRHGQGVTVCDFRKTATIDILEPFLEACPDQRERIAVMLDLLDARNEVVGYAVGLAVKRGHPAHLDRLRDLARRIVADVERSDAVAVAVGTQRWLEALVDAAGSQPIRWLANPFLELHQSLIRRFPALCVIEPSLPDYLHDFLSAFERGDAERCRELGRAYFQRVDLMLLSRLQGSSSAFPQPPTPPPWLAQE
jgi:GntR family transcriptional regulator, transcriptional repressor for pyruvate dehydrogenase complex